MIFYRYSGNIKAGLFILGVTLVLGLLAYNQILIKELRNDNREIVRLYSNIIANVIQDDSDTNLDFVFENIIQNGLVYGNKIEINIHKSNKRVIITIEDDGPGIPEDQYKNVFKPFFRLDKSRSLNQSDVGLGLAIVQDIINSHGGSIQLGKSKYNGLLVKIFLPF